VTRKGRMIKSRLYRDLLPLAMKPGRREKDAPL